MKNLKKLNETATRNMNGGSVAALIIAGMAIAAPYANVAWNIGQGIGQAIVNRRRK
jgi:hypothetical protein